MRKAMLKRKLKSIYMQIQKFDYNCGHALLCGISSDYYNLCKEYNNVADELFQIDKNCPSFRYKIK